MVGLILIPSVKLWNGFLTTYSLIPDSERISLEELRQEISQLEKELGTWKKGYTDGDTAYRHMNRMLYLGKYSPFYKEDNPRYGELGHLQYKLGRLKMESAALRGMIGEERGERIRLRFGELRDTAPDSEMGLRAKYTMETRSDWSLVWEHLMSRFLLSTAFAFFFFVSMLMYHDRLVEEIRDYLIFRIIVASVIWPIAMWYFPSHYLAHKAARTFIWLRCAVSAGMTLVPIAIGKAQKTSSGGEKPGESKNLVVSGLLFSDVTHDRQGILQFTKGPFASMIQSRVTTDSKTGLTFVGVGVAPRFGKILKLFVVAGPQQTYERHRIDRVVIFANGSLAVKKWTFVSVNRQSFGLDGAETPFGHRHIQTLRGPPMPSWLSINAEELYTRKKWRELFLGVNINLGGLMGKKKNFWKGVSLFPHWDTAKGSFDCRISYNFSHSF